MKYYTILIFFVWVLSSCTARRYIHATTAPNITYISEKNESQFNAALATGIADRYLGLDLHGACVPVENVVLVATYHYKNEVDEGENIPLENGKVDVAYKRNYLEIGAGYVLPFDGGKTGSFNFVMGYHYDNNKWKENGSVAEADEIIEYHRFFKGDKTGIFIQPSINYMSRNGFFKSAFYVKGDIVKLKAPGTDYTREEIEYYKYDNMMHRAYGYWVGGIDLNFRLSTTLPLYLSVSESLFPFSNAHSFGSSRFDARLFNFSIGLTYFP